MVAVLGGAALVAGMLFVSPAQAAMSCQSVPGSTIGADVKVGPVVQRVPAIANIKLCYGTGTVPVASVTFAGGTCTSNCLTVTLGGGAVDLEGVSLSWTEDGVLKTQAVNPAPVEGVPSTCVLSVGMPDAPNPGCFIAIGPDDPSGITGPIIATVNDAIDTALELAEDGYVITCSSIPDAYYQGYNYDFCQDPIGWTNAMSSAAIDDGYYEGCRRIPDRTDPYSGYRYDFCTDPIGWTNAVINTAANLVPVPDTYVCDDFGPIYDPQSGYDVYFCDDPVRWTVLYLQSWCGSRCDIATLDQLIYTIQRSIEIQAG